MIMSRGFESLPVRHQFTMNVLSTESVFCYLLLVSRGI